MTGFTAPARVGRGKVAAGVGLALAFALAGIGQRPLADPDEGRYAAAAWHMVESGDWIVPRLDRRPHITKSPAAYWATTLGLRLCGRTELGARLGVGLSFAAWILVAAALGRVLGRHPRAGWYAGACLATAALPFVGGSVVTADPFLALVSAMTIYAAARAVAATAHRRRWVAGFWLALGLGFFVKGPAGLLPLCGFAFGWSRRERPGADDRFSPALPLLAALVIALWWYAVMLGCEPAAARQLIHDELYARLFTDELRRSGPFWLPSGILLLGVMPWGPAAWSAWRRHHPAALGAAHRRLLLGWLAGGLLAFTASKSRQPLYVLPLATALLVPAGVVLASWSGSSRARRIGLNVTLALLAVVWLWVRIDAGRAPNYRHSQQLAAKVDQLSPRPDTPLVTLQAGLLPGLTFYLGRAPLHVALTEKEMQQQRHELDRAGLVDFVRRRGPVVAVGRAAALARLGKELRISATCDDRASGLRVARLEP